MKIKVLLPACQVPVGTTVSKRTGEAQYKLVDKFKIYGEGGEMIVYPPKDSLFLVNSGACSIIPNTTEIKWEVYEEDLMYFLQDREQERESK